MPDFTGCLLLATTPTPPAGTLVADGSEVSREAYAKLFAIFGTQYGEGDGVTTFTLPDWRDEFPRFSGAARAVLTTQGDAIRNITGHWNIRKSANDTTSIGGDDALYIASTLSGSAQIFAIGSGSFPNQQMSFDASRVVPTADENRPRNVAFLPCVIYV